ncbi:hypothetical protein ACIBM4_18645 [Streptomyces sp. NPDC050256]|uniref:hypothetical protein n=1 Tax=Streptomyces sp. NPDC050256 TaxID=3365607 RepID=UPI0037BA2F32
MITQDVKLKTQCEDCGGLLLLDLGQFVRNCLWWGTTGSCTACTNGWCEEDTGGTTPARIRDALLAEHGQTRLLLAGDESGSLVPAPVTVLLLVLVWLTLAILLVVRPNQPEYREGTRALTAAAWRGIVSAP